VNSKNASNDLNAYADDFSVMGALFGGFYFVGYGKIVIGIVLASLMLIHPLLMAVVALYGGFFANKQLDIENREFNWLNVAGLFVIIIVFAYYRLFY
jgi:hypothetical protein